MPHNEAQDDPQLGNKRNELIVQAARQLSAAMMVRFDELSNSFTISDLGRIAAKYYLRHQSMEVFSESLLSLSYPVIPLTQFVNLADGTVGNVSSLPALDAMFKPTMKNADLFAMLSQATEVDYRDPAARRGLTRAQFDQIQIRENEIPELSAILESDHCPMEVKVRTADQQVATVD